MIENRSSLILKQQLAHRFLERKLIEWGVHYDSHCKDRFGYVMDVVRFRLYPFWFPISEGYYEKTTLHYEGPRIPFFWSRSAWVSGSLHQESIAFSPSFIKDDLWPHNTEWRWTPTLISGDDDLKSFLLREATYGSWKYDDIKMIPYKTGCSGLEQNEECDSRWEKDRVHGMPIVKIGRKNLQKKKVVNL